MTVIPAINDVIVEQAIYTTSDVAQLLNVAESTVRRWVRDGKLISQNPGGHGRVLGAHLRVFISVYGSWRLQR